MSQRINLSFTVENEEAIAAIETAKRERNLSSFMNELLVAWVTYPAIQDVVLSAMHGMKSEAENSLDATLQAMMDEANKIDMDLSAAQDALDEGVEGINQASDGYAQEEASGGTGGSSEEFEGLSNRIESLAESQQGMASTLDTVLGLLKGMEGSGFVAAEPQPEAPKVAQKQLEAKHEIKTEIRNPLDLLSEEEELKSEPLVAPSTGSGRRSAVVEEEVPEEPKHSNADEEDEDEFVDDGGASLAAFDF